MYLNSVQIIGFIGKDPERRQRQGKPAEYTVFSVATHSSWKDAQGEWQSRVQWHRVTAWNRVGDQAIARLHSGDHVHIEGQIVSASYDRKVGDPDNPTTYKQTYWQVRATAIRKLDRTETPSGSTLAGNAPADAAAPDAAIPF